MVNTEKYRRNGSWPVCRYPVAGPCAAPVEINVNIFLVPTYICRHHHQLQDGSWPVTTRKESFHFLLEEPASLRPDGLYFEIRLGAFAENILGMYHYFLEVFLPG